MNNLTRYNAANLDQWTEFIATVLEWKSILIVCLQFTKLRLNILPYNLASASNVESRLELALAGFKKKEVYVYTQDGKLFVEGQKEDKETETNYLHKGLAQRTFTRSWTVSDDTEVRSVDFEDGLLSIVLGKVVPEAHKRKDYL